MQRIFNICNDHERYLIMCARLEFSQAHFLLNAINWMDFYGCGITTNNDIIRQMFCAGFASETSKLTETLKDFRYRLTEVCRIRPFLNLTHKTLLGHIWFFYVWYTCLNYYFPGFRQCGHSSFRSRHIQADAYVKMKQTALQINTSSTVKFQNHMLTERILKGPSNDLQVYNTSITLHSSIPYKALNGAV